LECGLFATRWGYLGVLHLEKKIKNHKAWFDSEIERIKKEYHL